MEEEDDSHTMSKVSGGKSDQLLGSLVPVIYCKKRTCNQEAVPTSYPSSLPMMDHLAGHSQGAVVADGDGLHHIHLPV